MMVGLTLMSCSLYVIIVVGCSSRWVGRILSIIIVGIIMLIISSSASVISIVACNNSLYERIDTSHSRLFFTFISKSRFIFMLKDFI